MRLPYQKSPRFSEIRRAPGGILPPVRPLCAFDLDHTLVRSPLDLPRLKVEIRALVESERAPLPEATARGRSARSSRPPRPAPAAARRGLLGPLHGPRGGRRSSTPSRSRARYEALTALRAAGYPLAIWTNNTGPVARRALASLRARRVLHDPGHARRGGAQARPRRGSGSSRPPSPSGASGWSGIPGWTARRRRPAARPSSPTAPTPWSSPAGAWRRARCCAICATSRSGSAPPPGSDRPRPSTRADRLVAPRVCGILTLNQTRRAARAPLDARPGGARAGARRAGRRGGGRRGAVRAGGAREPARGRAARRADASADPRRVRGPGASPRPGAPPPRRHRVGRPPLDDPLGTARHREDDARLPARRARQGSLHAVLRRAHRGEGGPRPRRRGRGAPRRPRPAHDPLRGRDPPLQQGAAGRVPPARRAGHGDPHRRDDREPVVRGDLGAALALPGLRARAPGRGGPRDDRAPRGDRPRARAGPPRPRRRTRTRWRPSSGCRRATRAPR